MDLEHEFNEGFNGPSEKPKQEFNSNKNWSNKSNWSKNKFSRAPFDKNEVPVKRLETDKVNFQVNYMTYTICISNKVEMLDEATLSKLRNIITTLESKGYLFRGLELKEYMEGTIRSSRSKMMDMIKEIDKLYSVGMYTFDKSKSDAFSIVKGMNPKYSDLKDIVKSFMARDLEIMIGDRHNRPVSMAIFVLGDDVNLNGNLDYKVTANCHFPIQIGKLIGKPIYNISNEEEYNQLVESMSKL